MKNACKKLAIILSLILLNTPAIAAEQSIQQDLIQDRAVLAKDILILEALFKIKKISRSYRKF
ncbi:hypothetical protein [Orientia tsutsugamushi]|uniref:TPR repeat protein n=1 Tax=Orientia tsutsugamushi str. TA716 TaxID=1359175 RepID=A0A0F3NRQ3_ORITS|nr:hypothetical protein [Orientia tsutsugamushi]KJV70446.1 TPR repeat protein [Orientia tsutsugamushi str. TA716]